jgi:hypothetical protein
MENPFASYEGISACWIEKCTFISGIVAMAQVPAGMVRDAMREMQAISDPNLNPEKYSRQVIDSYRQNRSEMDPTTARSVTIAAASTAVSEQGIDQRCGQGRPHCN